MTVNIDELNGRKKELVALQNAYRVQLELDPGKVGTQGRIDELGLMIDSIDTVLSAGEKGKVDSPKPAAKRRSSSAGITIVPKNKRPMTEEQVTERKVNKKIGESGTLGS